MVRRKCVPVNAAKKRDSFNEDSSFVSSEKNELSTKSTGTIKKSKRKSFVPKRRTIDDIKTSKMQVMRNGRVENMDRTTYKHMRLMQKTTYHLIPKLPFSRLVQEIMQDYGNHHVQPIAMNAIQEAAEIYLVHLFEISNILSLHAKRVTVKNTDMKLALQVRKMSGIID